MLLKGLFEKRRLLDYIRHFILWETDDGFIKKIAGYHQFHAANKAVGETVRASAPSGDKRIGVVWHTQGSGKSISMVFYAGKLILQPEMENPTLVVITDRNDLDGQLFSQFCAAKGLIPAPGAGGEPGAPEGAAPGRQRRGGLHHHPEVRGAQRGASIPLLSDRRNIVVIADEAHRSQYEFIDGFARNLRDGLPNASFIGFTGTPIEFDDKTTPAVFGDYIDTYTIVAGGRGRRHRADLLRGPARQDRAARGREARRWTTSSRRSPRARRSRSRAKLKTKWAKLEAMVGTEERLGLVAEDIVDHLERRTGDPRRQGDDRRACPDGSAVDLYDADREAPARVGRGRGRGRRHQGRDDRLGQRPARTASRTSETSLG